MNDASLRSSASTLRKSLFNKLYRHAQAPVMPFSGMRLQPVIHAPEVHAVDSSGQEVTLDRYKGSLMWLVFSRWASCPFCSLRLDRIARSFHLLQEAEVRMLVVFPSPVERIAKYVEAYTPPFDTASDEERNSYARFGTETSWVGDFKSVLNLPKTYSALKAAKLSALPVDGPANQMPADFLLDRKGQIHKVHYGQELDDGFSVAEVCSWANEVRGSAR